MEFTSLKKMAFTELKSSQNFIYRNFKKHEKCKELRPTSGRPRP